MKVFKTLVIDDERLAREELKLLLKDYIEIEVIGEGKNAEEGIQFVKDLKPDLIFLDVSMPGMNGFEMIRQLDEMARRLQQLEKRLAAVTSDPQTSSEA